MARRDEWQPVSGLSEALVLAERGAKMERARWRLREQKAGRERAADGADPVARRRLGEEEWL